MEREGHGYSVYCKRGRRAAIEDRFSAVVGLEGDPKQVISWSSDVCLFYFVFFSPFKYDYSSDCHVKLNCFDE